MEELTKDSTVKLDDGEIVTIQEYVARTFSRQVADAMAGDSRNLTVLHEMVNRGATFDDLWPFYDKFVPDKTRAVMSFLEIDPKALFKRIHDACMSKALN